MANTNVKQVRNSAGENWFAPNYLGHINSLEDGHLSYCHIDGWKVASWQYVILSIRYYQVQKLQA